MIKNFLTKLAKSVESKEAVIRIFLGKTGSGKTLIQTEEYVLPALIEGLEVYCSYWINWNKPNYHYFNAKDFNAIVNVRNAVVVFDEVRRSFDPRRWESESEQVREWFEMHRHNHNTIIGNSQDVSLIAKTIAGQSHEWVQLQKIEPNILVKLIYKFLNIEYPIVIEKDYLTWQELKKMAMGWDIGEIVDINADWEKSKYKLTDLYHFELDDFKQELVHKYCPDCKERQADQILKEDTLKVCDYDAETDKYYLKTEEYCPKHKQTLLEVRYSCMFDSYYTPEKAERKDIVFKPFVPSPEGYKMIDYKGSLSFNQQDYKAFLEKRINIKKQK